MLKLSKPSHLNLLHKLNIVIDNIFRKQYLSFIKCQEPVEYHIPAHGGDHAEDIADPLDGELLEGGVGGDEGELLGDGLEVHDDLVLTTISIWDELIQHVIVLLLIPLYLLRQYIRHQFLTLFKHSWW